MSVSSTTQHSVNVAASAAEEKGGFDCVALDVSEPLPFVECFLIVSGRSERNVQSIANEIEDKLFEHGVKPIRREGKAQGRWILLDFGDLVVHVFLEEERMFYSLERLWNDCPVVAVSSV